MMWSFHKIINLTFLLALIQYCYANFLTETTIIGGNMFPEQLIVKEGSDINFRLENPFETPQICRYRSPKSTRYEEIGSDPHVAKWTSELCGILVRNVSKIRDEGIWRLSSSKNNDFIRSTILVIVEPKTETTDDEIMEELSYCVVNRPGETAFPQIGSCNIPQNLPGDWTLNKGFVGQNKEEIEQVYHEPKVEKLSVNVEKERSGTINLLCNLENSDRMIKACRFLRVSDNMALNVDDGLGSDHYRFYGRGLEYGECGISIENPRPLDKSMWKCYITTHTTDKEPEEKGFGSILDANDTPTSLRLTFPGRQALINGVSSNISCNANLPINYCWFRKPNGEILAVSDKHQVPSSDEDEELPSFSYYGSGFGLGECGITLHNVKPEDAGQWRCSAGTAKAGFEAQQLFQVDVRTTDALILAEMSQLDINQGDSFKIECKTVTPHLPLEQCHFVTPTGTGFSIDETVTSDNSLGAYYFNPNRNMRSGWCSLVVKRARKEHSGTWKCIAKAHMWTTEGIDTMVVQVRSGISIAMTVGGTVIALIVIMSIVVLTIYTQRRRKLNRIRLENRELQNQRRESNTSRESNNSGIELENPSNNIARA